MNLRTPSSLVLAILNELAMMAATADYRMAGGIGGLLSELFMVLRSLIQWDGRALC